VFKVEREEALYLYNKVKCDYEEAYQAHTDKCRVMDISHIKRIIRASNEDVDKAIESYVNLLVEQLKPDYIKSLRASLRSVRSRNKRLGKFKVSSVTVDVDLKTYYSDQKLTNADVIKLAVEALHKELAYA